MNIIDVLQWRYATKKFDSTKKIKSSDLDVLKESVLLSASSYGLQLYKILVITDPIIREQLKTVSSNQNQVSEASHLFVFCIFDKFREVYVDQYMSIKSKIRDINPSELSTYGKRIKENIASLTTADFYHWTSRQVYICLANLMMACASLKIDSCPMEGFDSEKYEEILGLKKKGLKAVVICPVGYRSSEDGTQYDKKVRRELSNIFEDI